MHQESVDRLRQEAARVARRIGPSCDAHDVLHDMLIEEQVFRGRVPSPQAARRARVRHVSRLRRERRKNPGLAGLGIGEPVQTWGGFREVEARDLVRTLARDEYEQDLFLVDAGLHDQLDSFNDVIAAHPERGKRSNQYKARQRAYEHATSVLLWKHR